MTKLGWRNHLEWLRDKDLGTQQDSFSRQIMEQTQAALTTALWQLDRIREAAEELVAEYESHGGRRTHQDCMPGCGCGVPEAVAALQAVLGAEGEG